MFPPRPLPLSASRTATGAMRVDASPSVEAALLPTPLRERLSDACRNDGLEMSPSRLSARCQLAAAPLVVDRMLGIAAALGRVDVIDALTAVALGEDAAVDAVGELAARDAHDALARVIQEALDPSVRAAAFKALGSRAVAPARSLARSGSEADVVRDAALRVLAEHAPEALAPILDAMDLRSTPTLTACTALGLMARSGEAPGRVLAALTDGRRSVVLAAADGVVARGLTPDDAQLAAAVAVAPAAVASMAARHGGRATLRALLDAAERGGVDGREAARAAELVRGRLGQVIGALSVAGQGGEVSIARSGDLAVAPAASASGDQDGEAR